MNFQCLCVASGTYDKAKSCVMYIVREDILLQHAVKSSCYFVLGTKGEQLSVLASDQMLFFLNRLCSSGVAPKTH